MSKFNEKNTDELSQLNDYINKNRDNIQALIISPEMIHFLCEEQYNEKDEQMIMYKYNDIRIIVDYYSPVKTIRILHKDNNKFDFNVPCVCGIYPDEPHDHKLK